jgi:ATP-dependent protease ClpP protease subunit
MAIPVFQACKVRIMAESATMLLHSGEMTNTMQSLDVFDADLIANWVKKNQEEENAYDDMILAGIKSDKARNKEFVLTRGKIRKWRRENKVLSASEALDHGLCDIVMAVQDIFAIKILGSFG